MEIIITWDEPKRQANIAKHGLDFADLTLEFFQDSMVSDAKQSRYRAIGTLKNGIVCTIFATLGTEAISIISLRPASTKERKHYDQQI